VNPKRRPIGDERFIVLVIAPAKVFSNPTRTWHNHRLPLTEEGS